MRRLAILGAVGTLLAAAACSGTDAPSSKPTAAATSTAAVVGTAPLVERTDHPRLIVTADDLALCSIIGDFPRRFAVKRI